MSSETAFEDLTHEFLADYLEFYPTTGSRLGLHLYDGRTEDFSQPSIDTWLRALDSWDRRLAGFTDTLLTPEHAHDAALIRQTITYERFRWKDLRDHQRDPTVGSGALDVTTYLKRNYAPLPERVRALVSHLEHIPGYLEQLRSHLQEPLAAPLVETAKEIYNGYLSFFTGSLPQEVAGIDDHRLRDRFTSAHETTLGALRDHLAFLHAAGEHATGDFAIGEDLFTGMLRAGEMVEVPLDRLLGLGEAELNRLLEDVRATAARIDPSADPRDVMTTLGRDHPNAEALLDETRTLLEDLRRFLIEREIVTIPDDVRPLVEETPPFARWAFAMMDTAGPFEQAAMESYYYVTLPEPSWPPAQRDEWLTKFDYATLKDVSIHEAYPGHFVHFLHVHRAPSVAAKVFTAYSFVEGWAHYCEEMMLEAGVDPSPRYRLAFLGEALARQVRYLGAIRMHAGGMPVEEATRMFREHAYMEPATAHKEAVRGTFDPGYLNYTLGKFMMRRLRDDYRAERGGAFSLREFHDRVIGLGAPPFPLARRALLRHEAGSLL